MTENGNGNDGNKTSERDAMGRFVKGAPGGPGRGKKADELDLTNLTEDEFWAAMEVLNRQDIMSKDPMTRQRAMKLKVMKDEYLLKKGAESDGRNIITLEVIDLLKARSLLPYFGGVEGLEKMLKVCPGCSKFHVTKPRVFNLPGDTEEPEAGGGPDLGEVRAGTII